MAELDGVVELADGQRAEETGGRVERIPSVVKGWGHLQKDGAEPADIVQW